MPSGKILIPANRYRQGGPSLGSSLALPARRSQVEKSSAILSGMDVERVIDEIQQLEEMFEAPDIRPFNASHISAANRKHDERLAQSPWFRLWQDFGVCCRPEAPVIRLPE